MQFCAQPSPEDVMAITFTKRAVTFRTPRAVISAPNLKQWLPVICISQGGEYYLATPPYVRLTSIIRHCCCALARRVGANCGHPEKMRS
jgi:hypothetical protein